MVKLRQTAEFAVPPEVVWGVLTDLSGWPRWGPVRSVIVEESGDAHGVGQIRAMKTWGGTVRERVTSVQPNEGFTYELLSGAPVKNYRGRMSLQPRGSGTSLTWEVEFDAPWYSRFILRRIAIRTLASTARGLSSELA
jgi:uncharacterized protein YndB with AHSA1/START domain